MAWWYVGDLSSLISECAMRREHRRPPILKLGVLVHAFVAAVGVFAKRRIVTMQFRCREFWRCSLVLDFCCGCYGGLFILFLNGFLMKKWGAKTSNPSQIDQNWGQERSKNDPGSKTFWVPPNTRYVGLEIWDLWHHLADFGAILDPIGFRRGRKIDHFWTKIKK